MALDRRLLLTSMLAAIGASSASAEPSPPQVGRVAPEFVAIDSDGRTVSLHDFAGKVVVLEWTNPECPFVAKHYRSGNMPALQREARAAGVVWLMVSSAAPGNMGYLDALEAAELVSTRNAAPTHFLLDHDGRMLADYGVNVALTMAIIDASGTLAYLGAIDDVASAKVEDIARARNYVREALAALAAGRPVKTAQTRPYGCVAR